MQALSDKSMHQYQLVVTIIKQTMPKVSMSEYKIKNKSLKTYF